MEFSGLISKYPINRPLTDQEKTDRLNPIKKLDYIPHYNLSVIKINSTYLEVVDKFYAWKGSISWVAMMAIGLVGGGYVFFFLDILFGELPVKPGAWLFLAVTGAMALVFLGVMFWHLLREMATYTHYPIRLNRNTRMVYVFRRDGTVLKAPWDDLFITLAPGSYDYVVRRTQWNLRAHVLDSDGETVRETFAFPSYAFFKEELYNYWEFVRRYMEEGPAKLIGSEIGQVEVCHPIADRKESFGWSMQLIYSHFATAPIAFWLFSPFLTLVGLARYLANLTCDVPVWPKSVEDACPIEPGDAFARDHRDNPANLLRLVSQPNRGGESGRPGDHTKNATSQTTASAPSEENTIPQQKNEDGTGFIRTAIRYEDVVWYRKRWFLMLTVLFFIPAAITIAASGDIYANQKGVVYKYSSYQKVTMIIALAVLMVLFVFRAFNA